MHAVARSVRATGVVVARRSRVAGVKRSVVKTQRRFNTTDLPSTPESNTERNNLRKNTEPEQMQAEKFAGKPVAKSVEDAANMQSERVEKIVKEILALNILEAAQLSKALQTALGVSPAQFAPAAAAPAQAAAATAAAAAAAPADAAKDAKAEEKKDGKPAGAPKAGAKQDVKLVSFPEANKFKVLKEIRTLKPGMNLMESKALIEGLPKIVIKELPSKQAEEWKTKLTDAGAVVELV